MKDWDGIPFQTRPPWPPVLREWIDAHLPPLTQPWLIPGPLPAHRRPAIGQLRHTVGTSAAGPAGYRQGLPGRGPAGGRHVE